MYTAKNQYRKFETNVPRKGIARPQSQFPHHVSVRYLYIPTIDLPILLQEICGPILRNSQKRDFHCSVYVFLISTNAKCAELLVWVPIFLPVQPCKIIITTPKSIENGDLTTI
jgi:hypothetical protein